MTMKKTFAREITAKSKQIDLDAAKRMVALAEAQLQHVAGGFDYNRYIKTPPI
jgi:hypothetical protein